MRILLKPLYISGNLKLNYILINLLKAYFRYYLNRSIIYSIFTLNRVLDYNFFKKYNQKYPQTFLIINTSRGIRTIDFCIKNNLGGKLVLRLN